MTDGEVGSRYTHTLAFISQALKRAHLFFCPNIVELQKNVRLNLANRDIYNSLNSFVT
jgi:hypothetical protein